jgi:hypothetical protein
MAQKVIRIVQGDNLPQLSVVLTEDTTGDPFDLTGATVTLRFRAVGGANILFARNAIIPAAQAINGQAYFVFTEADFNIAAGNYEGEIEAYWAQSDQRQTAFETVKFRVREDFA